MNEMRYYEGTKKYEYNGSIIGYHVGDLMDVLSRNKSRITYVAKDGSEFQLEVIKVQFNTCNDCYFNGNGKDRYRCISYCSFINYLRVDEDENESFNLTVSHLKRKLCNPDLCSYVGNCKSAPFCLLNHILSEEP